MNLALGRGDLQPHSRERGPVPIQARRIAAPALQSSAHTGLSGTGATATPVLPAILSCCPAAGEGDPHSPAASSLLPSP